MSTNHDAVAALPITGSASKTLLRNLAVARMPYVLADSDVVTNLVAIDPSTGASIVDILFLGRVFHYDSTDTTTANDGVSCLVSFEGRRYKLSSSSDVFAFAVLNGTTSTPPGSPTIGDSYRIAAGATGAWSGKSNYITVFTKRGWEFINFGIGRFIYDEAQDAYWHKNAGGTWVTGIGTQTLAAGSVPITAVLGANASFVIKIENQTTNTPPGSPSTPTAYIVGSSPTGAWVGNTGKLAICLVAGSFTIITPVLGDAVFDKALNTSFQFNGTSWQSSIGALIGHASSFVAAAHGALVSAGGNYSYNPTTSPVNKDRFVDNNSVTYTARAASVPLRFDYQANLILGALSQSFVLGLYRDSEATPVDYLQIIGGPTFLAMTVNCMFTCVSNDASSHTYAVSSVYNASSSGASSFNRSTLTVLEYAS
jgi:hypothetical protein